MKIIALNLPREKTQEEITELFSKFGQVASCDLVMDTAKNISKGFGFIEMPDEAEATAAITGLHGKKIGGNKIRVKISDQNS